jgi:hypothetical protein
MGQRFGIAGLVTVQRGQGVLRQGAGLHAPGGGRRAAGQRLLRQRLGGLAVAQQQGTRQMRLGAVACRVAQRGMAVQQRHGLAQGLGRGFHLLQPELHPPQLGQQFALQARLRVKLTLRMQHGGVHQLQGADAGLPFLRLGVAHGAEDEVAHRVGARFLFQ